MDLDSAHIEEREEIGVWKSKQKARHKSKLIFEFLNANKELTELTSDDDSDFKDDLRQSLRGGVVFFALFTIAVQIQNCLEYYLYAICNFSDFN